MYFSNKVRCTAACAASICTKMSKKITDPKTLVLYNTWCRIRKPFAFPLNQTIHDCSMYWEKFDIDKAACTMCAKYHLCEHGDCDYVMTEDSLVCCITGLCVKPKILSADEHVCVAVHRSHNFLQFTSESGNLHPTDDYAKKELFNTNTRKIHGRCTDELNIYHAKRFSSKVAPVHLLQSAICSTFYEDQMVIVLATLKHILCSDKTQLSVHKENEKLKYHLRGVIPKTLRAFKVLRKIPSICDLEAQLHLANTHGRIPPTVEEWDKEYSWQLAKQAAIPITRLIIFMRTFCTNVPICVRQNTIIVGLLYMLRRGVVVHNVTVLPTMSALRIVLPLEQHLVTVFNIKAKIITEAENVIKFNLRTLPYEILHLLHMPM
jgi:hypothetical protein